jgi:hypothetical protein
MALSDDRCRGEDGGGGNEGKNKLAHRPDFMTLFV